MSQDGKKAFFWGEVNLHGYWGSHGAEGGENRRGREQRTLQLEGPRATQDKDFSPPKAGLGSSALLCSLLEISGQAVWLPSSAATSVTRDWKHLLARRGATLPR